ncbi:MAG: VOC family protein [Bacteroidota bacterium]
MKRFYFLLILAFPADLLSQEQEQLSLNAYFSAIIVADMDTSLAWYTDVLGYEMVNQHTNQEVGFRIVNLKRADTLLELIEWQSAHAPKEVIPNFGPKTRLHGLFKIGFQVAEFEQWLEHLNGFVADIQEQVVHDPISGNRMLIIKDPDGNRIQLFEQ